ncbi:hypothetical protein Avbf_00063 [Armadillidium vulgare]|nr:hypothetical protein Avbf_00063 [Armadillidium vulgare]
MLARTCREGPRTPKLSTELLQGRRTARRNLALLVRRLHVLSYSRVPPRILSREFVVSSVKARVLSSSASAPRLRSLRKQPLYETSFLAACLLAAAARTCKRGPRTPNSRPSSARQADSETQLGSPCTASPRPLLLESPSEDSQPRVRCVERKGVCGQKGALVSASAPRLRSLRKQPLYETSFLAAFCWRLLHGRAERRPELRTLAVALQAGGQRDATWLSLYGVSTSSPTRKSLRGFSAESSLCRAASNSAKDPSETWRYSPNPSETRRYSQNFDFFRTLDQALQGRRTARRNLALLVLRLHVLSYSQVPPRILSREFVVSSVKACVDRRVLSSQLLPLAYARSGSNLSTKPKSYAAFLLAAAARTCREGPELRTLDQALRARRTAGRNLALLLLQGCSRLSFCHSPTLAPEATSLRNLPSQLSAGGCCTTCREGPNSNSRPSSASSGQRDATCLSLHASPRPLLLASPSEDSQPRVRCVERKGVCGQKGALVSASALAYARSGSNLSTKPPFLAACLLADAARTCREGPRTPNSRPSSASQADSETQLGSPCTASPRPLLLESPSEDSQPRVRCVERKGVCGQKGALVSASAPRLRSLRKQPLYETSFLAACLLAAAARTCKRGPRTPNSRPSSAGQADSGTQLGSSSTASPPHKASNSAKDPSETWRYSPKFDFLRASPKTEGLVPRFLGRQFVVSSVKACVDRRVLSSQLLPLAYARSGSNLSTKNPFWQLVCWRLLHGRAREGPELRTLDQALQGRRTTGRNFGCSSTASPRPLLLTSPSEIDLRGNLALIASPTRGLGRVSRPPSP